MTDEMHKHLQGVIYIRSSQSGNHSAKVCHSPLLRYNINTGHACNCNQETAEQTTVTVASNSQDLMTSSSCKVIVEKMLLLFCLFMYIINVL